MVNRTRRLQLPPLSRGKDLLMRSYFSDVGTECASLALHQIATAEVGSFADTGVVPFGWVCCAGGHLHTVLSCGCEGVAVPVLL